MTREGYTHVLIPNSFHSVLKAEAEKNKTSIWRFIDKIIQSNNNMVEEQPGKLVGLSPSGVRISLSASSFSQDEIGTKSDFSNDCINTKEFEKFLLVQRNLNKATVKNHISYLDIFLKSVNKDIHDIEVNDIQDFMLGIKEKRTLATYKNYLSMLKIFFRDYMGKEDMIKDFKFPRQDVKPKFLPSKKDLKILHFFKCQE